MLRPAFLVTLIVLALSPLAHAQGWQTFTSPDGKFTVSMPGTPTPTTSQSSSPVGDITTSTYAAQAPGENVSVSTSDLPGIAVFFGGSGRIFSGAISDFLKTVGGTQLTLTDTSLQGHPGKVLAYQTADAVGQANFYLVGNRLYVLNCTRSNAGPVPPQPIEDFFSSFALQ